MPLGPQLEPRMAVYRCRCGRFFMEAFPDPCRQVCEHCRVEVLENLIRALAPLEPAIPTRSHGAWWRRFLRAVDLLCRLWSGNR